MSFNTFGHLFRFTTFGESHGAAIGCVVDGCPPRIPLDEADIQRRSRQAAARPVALHHPAPGAGRGEDHVRRVHRRGDGEQVTTGTPIMLLIENVDQRSKDYSEIKDKYRPGHADYTYDVKYGIRDYRGGGRASARETAARVAAGAIARKIVPGLTVRGALVQMGPHKIDRARWDWNEVGNNPFFCPDAKQAKFFEDYLDGVRKAGSSVGAVIEVVAEGVPAGLGAPVYAKLDGDLAARADGHQCGQGRRDRRRLCHRGDDAARKMPTRCAWAMTASRCFCPTMPAAFSAASRPGSRSSRALPSSRPRRS